MSTVYGVEVSYLDENPATFGPYTKDQAERVTAALMKEVEIAEKGTAGINLHPLGVRGAAAFPLGRYDQLLDGPARIKLRADVREYNAAQKARRKAAAEND